HHQAYQGPQQSEPTSEPDRQPDQTSLTPGVVDDEGDAPPGSEYRESPVRSVPEAGQNKRHHDRHRVDSNETDHASRLSRGHVAGLPHRKRHEQVTGEESGQGHVPSLPEF